MVRLSLLTTVVSSVAQSNSGMICVGNCETTESGRGGK